MAKKAARKMTKKKGKPIQAFAFIDTNIFLDFYRSSNESTLTLLEKLSSVQDRIISTYQVEMEFLKNRQMTLLKALGEITIDVKASVPAVLSDKQTKDSFDKLKKEGASRVKKLKSRVEKLLSNPNAEDRVYRVLEGIFSSEHSHVLTREMPERQEVKRLALRRFLLGYPPRKDKDTSYGDALNWEWIIKCSKNMRGRIYIVSRDGDFGCEHNNKFYLNDQLKKEFRDRLGNKSIVYTKKLSEALRALEVHVTQKEEAAEESILSKTIQPSWSSTLSDEIAKNFQQAVSPFRSEEFRSTLENLRSAMALFNDEGPQGDPDSIE